MESAQKDYVKPNYVKFDKQMEDQVTSFLQFCKKDNLLPGIKDKKSEIGDLRHMKLRQKQEMLRASMYNNLLPQKKKFINYTGNYRFGYENCNFYNEKVYSNNED